MTTIDKEKKILIVSKSGDLACKLFKQWLLSYGVQFVSLYYDKMNFSITRFNVVDVTFKFQLNDKEYDINSFHAVYFFRGALQLTDYSGTMESMENVKDFKSAFKYYRMAYETSIKEIVDFAVHDFNTIGHNNGGRINKLKMLSFAHKVGLKIPNTLATKNKKDLKEFFEECDGNVITKCLDINMVFNDPDTKKLLHAMTSKIDREDLNVLPDYFPLTVFQKNIPKLVELRVFFIGDDNYASAIFSQNSDHTKQDYRNYDMDVPNRVVPYVLPEVIHKRLNDFKRLANLRTGSFDIIVTPENEYVFLEVNPQGQFIGVSDYCNYNLEIKVVKYLMS